MPIYSELSPQAKSLVREIKSHLQRGNERELVLGLKCAIITERHGLDATFSNVAPTHCLGMCTIAEIAARKRDGIIEGYPVYQEFPLTNNPLCSGCWLENSLTEYKTRTDKLLGSLQAEVQG